MLFTPGRNEHDFTQLLKASKHPGGASQGHLCGGPLCVSFGLRLSPAISTSCHAHWPCRCGEERCQPACQSHSWLCLREQEQVLPVTSEGVGITTALANHHLRIKTKPSLCVTADHKSLSRVFGSRLPSLMGCLRLEVFTFQ